MNQSPKPPLGLVGRFFFTPTDPTTLGFIRIMAGLLIIYTHLAYCADLKWFLGPDAWWGHEVANRQRRESPIIASTIGWNEQKPSVVLDTTIHRRGAAIDFMRQLPESAEERSRKLRFLKVVYEQTPSSPMPDLLNPDPVANALYLTYSAGLLTDEQRDKMVSVLRKDVFDPKDAPITGFPPFVYSMTPNERMIFWNDLLEFITVLPADGEQQEYVRAWLSIYPPDRREDFIKFLSGTKKEGTRDMSLPAEAGPRQEFLQFLETWGIDPRQSYHQGIPIFSVWLHITSPTTMWFVHGALIVVFCMFTLGLYTRTTSVLTWMGTLFYIHRAQVYLFGQDTMQTILIFYLMIGPSGAALSLDALRARYRAARTILSGQRSPWADAVLNGPQPSWMANMVIRMLQIHFCFIYGSSGISKLKGPTWWDHSAGWMTMVNPEFGLIRYRAYEWMIEMFAEFRLIAAIVSGGIGIFTLIMEVGWPFLVWTRLRPLMIIGSVLLHFGIALMMGLTMFGLYMMTLCSCYFPAALIRQRVSWPVGSGSKMTLEYDSRSPVAVRKAALVRAVDLAQQVTITDMAKTNKEVTPTISLVAPDHRRTTGDDLFKTVVRELPLLRCVVVLAKFPGVWPVVKKLYAK